MRIQRLQTCTSPVAALVGAMPVQSESLVVHHDGDDDM